MKTHRMKTHRTDAVSLVFGLLFLGAVGVWLIGPALSVRLPLAGWLLAGALIVVGILGLIGAVRGGSGTDASDDLT
jgi:hypothetical protein